MGESSNALLECFKELVTIIAQLRNPVGGCPWDIKQTHQSLRPYMIEEAYEAIDAIDALQSESGSTALLCEELGDVLLQVVLHSQIGSDNGTFTMKDVIEGLNKKLIARHPHVFGSEKAETAEEVLKNWERIKQKDAGKSKGVLDGVPRVMPALLRSHRMGEKAARVGFDWATLRDVGKKVLEEVQELVDETPDTQEGFSQRAQEELGDLLFSLAQWARKAGVNAEEILHFANEKFSKRFRGMEARATKPLNEYTVDELEELWQLTKNERKTS